MTINEFAGLAGRQILVVEDEYLIALSLADELEACGAQVLGPASSLASALVLIDAHAPDAAILDIQLQSEFCYPAADILMARATPLIFTTGHDSGVVPPAYAHVPCVQKPAAAATVLEALARLL